MGKNQVLELRLEEIRGGVTHVCLFVDFYVYPRREARDPISRI